MLGQIFRMRRKLLEVPPNTLSCCGPQTRRQVDTSRTETYSSHPSSESLGLLSQLSSRIDSAFNVLQQSYEPVQDYSSSSFEGEDLFHSLGAQRLSHDMTRDIISHDIEPINLDGGSFTDPMALDLNHDTFNFHMQDTLPKSLSPVHRNTLPARTSSSHHNSPFNKSTLPPSTTTIIVNHLSSTSLNGQASENSEQRQRVDNGK